MSRFTAWADGCPENFAHKQRLLAAELARLDGQPERAATLYAESARLAHASGFVQDQALAHELAARFYRQRGFEVFADAHLSEAILCYRRWGADAKVAALERLRPGPVASRSPFGSTATLVSRAEQLDMISVARASQALSREVVLDRLLRTLMEKVLAQGGAETAYLLLRDDDERRRDEVALADSLSIQAEAALEPGGTRVATRQGTPAMSSAQLPATVLAAVCQSGQTLALEDAVESPFARDDYIARNQPRSVLCLPIVRQAEVVGLLYLENNAVVGAFTPERLSALELLAAQTAISLENVRLLEQERAARQAAEQAEQRSTLLAEGTTRLAESLDYQTTLTSAVRLGVRVADFCIIDMADQGGRLSHAAAAHARPDKEDLLRELDRRGSAELRDGDELEAIVRAGAVKVHLDEGPGGVEAALRLPQPQVLRALEAKSCVRLPLLARGRAFGAITFGAATRRFDDGDVCLLAELARRVAMAIDNAQLYRDSQEAVRLRDEFLTLASHELNTPTAALALSLQDMLSEASPLSADVVKMARLAERQGRRLTRLVRDLLDVTWIRRGVISLEREDVDLGALVREAVESFREQLARARCEVALDCPERIVGRWDPLRLMQVVTNLLSNAVKFGAGRLVVLRVSRVGDLARITVADQGIGIDPGQQERIFERFARGVTPEHYAGLGLGLYVCRRILEAHGGSIRVHSQPGHGATFTVDLPA